MRWSWNRQRDEAPEGGHYVYTDQVCGEAGNEYPAVLTVPTLSDYKPAFLSFHLGFLRLLLVLCTGMRYSLPAMWSHYHAWSQSRVHAKNLLPSQNLVKGWGCAGVWRPSGLTWCTEERVTKGWRRVGAVERKRFSEESIIDLPRRFGVRWRTRLSEETRCNKRRGFCEM